MPIMFPETGCEKCRNYWTHPFMEDRDKVMDLLQTNMKQQARLYKCNHCAAYWEEPNGAYPCGLTDEEVEKIYGVKTHNKAKQHRSLRSLDSLALAPFVHGFAIIAQNPQSQVCRCWRRYAINMLNWN